MKFNKQILTVLTIIFFLIFINAKNDNYDFVVPKEPLNLDKTAFYIENMRSKTYPDVKIKIEKLVGEKKEYKSYLISYKVDSLNLFALMLIPNSIKPKNGYPVVVVNHGYIPPKKYSTVESYRNVSLYFASNGFIVLKPDYRGFGDSINVEKSFFNRIFFPVDVLFLVNSIKNIPEADNSNIFMLGHSLGGDVTLRLLEITDRIKAASLWAPVSEYFPENTLYYVRKRSEEKAEEIKLILDKNFSKEDNEKISGLSNTVLIKTPLILHHSTLDDSVPYEWSVNLMKKLDENKVNYKFYSYEEEDHNFAKGSFYKVLKRDLDFFKSKMK